ncbi:eukaryotic translation initiation factor 2 subunit 2-like [Planococcus citri]|uniref:eukaryotic translation initiation factor 2 subunit 2-like n=1 Tax=Planococcus citri TaxID=170843 RepID=UPI0031F904A1
MDEEPMIDFFMKKKKKKNSNLDAVLVKPPDDDGELMHTSTTLDKENQEPTTNNENFDDGSLHLDSFGKKEKKKRATFNLDELNNALPEGGTMSNDDFTVDLQMGPETIMDREDFDLDMDFSKMKKKKKKKKDLDELAEEEVERNLESRDEGSCCTEIEAPSVIAEDESQTWSGSDRDYTYDELLARVFNHPDMVASKKQKFIVKPPQVLPAGAKKTSFVNFNEICKTLHRSPKHLLDFLKAELGTSGSVHGEKPLIIKGRFQQKQIENVLKRYIKEYVNCHTCQSPKTILQKDTRLYFLQCETCASRCSVASIKSGFQAVTVKRAAIRAKTV